LKPWRREKEVGNEDRNNHPLCPLPFQEPAGRDVQETREVSRLRACPILFLRLPAVLRVCGIGDTTQRCPLHRYGKGGEVMSGFETLSAADFPGENPTGEHRLSMFRSITDTAPRTVTLADLRMFISEDMCAELVDRIRAEPDKARR